MALFQLAVPSTRNQSITGILSIRFNNAQLLIQRDWVHQSKRKRSGNFDVLVLPTKLRATHFHS